MKIHFFTIVLNGQPYIERHKAIFDQLSVDWHWHIIEGVAEHQGDTAWSLKNDATIPAEFHKEGLSVDGTSEYIDQLQKEAPQRISIYRKPAGQFWQGKLEMVNAPLPEIHEECLLWQVDADEIWTTESIEAMHRKFIEQPARTAAYYWCWFYVTPDKVISSRYGYGANPKSEWLRTWRYKPGDTWRAHEPPKLCRRLLPGSAPTNLAQLEPFSHEETEAAGAVFRHYAYTEEAQLRFKESYYGYKGAVDRWHALHSADMPANLSDYFNWVQEPTLVDEATQLGLDTIDTLPKPRIVVDGIFFQHSTHSGIARYWRAVLEKWAQSGFAQHVVCIVRGNHSPNVAGIHYYPARMRLRRAPEADSLYLQDICDQLQADVFVSTYFSAPLRTPTLFAGHDMIPERMSFNMGQDLQDKSLCIRQAQAHTMVSKNSAQDLEDLYDCVPTGSTTVVSNGLDSEVFYPPTSDEVSAFCKKHNLNQPYLLFVGKRVKMSDYKNAGLAYRALANWPGADAPEMVFFGGKAKLEKPFCSGSVRVHHLQLDDAALRCAYGGAFALAFPSRYEGFGLPILEAMACGCPVVTCKNSSLPEVGGDAVQYVSEDDASEMVAALQRLKDPETRATYIEAGLARSREFDWEESAAVMAEALLKLADANPNVPQEWERKRRRMADQEANAGHTLEREGKGQKDLKYTKSWKRWVHKIKTRIG